MPQEGMRESRATGRYNRIALLSSRHPSFMAAMLLAAMFRLARLCMWTTDLWEPAGLTGEARCGYAYLCKPKKAARTYVRILWLAGLRLAREAHTYQIVNGGSYRLHQPTSTTNFLCLPSHYTRC
ncbi:uncharacterized protein MYCFIDRAFT_179961 [Pseudocercospora fijiensis CIRAD86]|uniref:Uncharacterized protein n=1 Tax=Pseudocercospora fijiensis (strain CIRAD86) TaxID=383855 RepID=M3AIU6_PSEFD|nr:uncharacterized protein MYCFIDRAFT_179961 [Pseudocercospora fijiensis CIRAD86]EME77392.1 hypothetical protein MYCFIDRAFT_179961 [Pseudocercospora fijiensis CIRAD86]